MENGTLKINEIFFSIQGENSLAGRPAVFVRLSSGENKGRNQGFKEILQSIKTHGADCVGIIGDEPLEQKGIFEFLAILIDEGFTVSLETRNSRLIPLIPKEVVKILEVRGPDSGESIEVFWEKLLSFRPQDQVKFVLYSRNDFEWAESQIRSRELAEKCSIFFSPVPGRVSTMDLARWMMISQPYGGSPASDSRSWDEGESPVV